MEQSHTFSTLITVLKADIQELIATKMELARLEVLEKSSTAGSFLIFGLIIINLIFFAILFAFVALGFLFGKWLESAAGGFAIVTLIYLVLLIILIACRKPILNSLKNLFLKELDPDLTDEAKYEAKHVPEAQVNRRTKRNEHIINDDRYELD